MSPIGGSSRGWNAPDLRKRNRAGVLRLVHARGDIARNELAFELGLTKAAVSILVNELIAEGLISEAGEQRGERRAGRRKIALRLRPEAGALLGVGIDSERTQLILCDLAGKPLAVRELPPPNEAAGGQTSGRPRAVIAEAFASNLGTAARELLAAAGLGAKALLGAGVGVSGRVDELRGVSLREPRLWEGELALRAPLEGALGICVSVDNNVRALALAELLLCEERSTSGESILFTKYGPGVGAAWTMGGRAWPGAHHRSGELGHTVVASEGPACPYCGRVGCLESLVSARALGERLGLEGRPAHELCAILRERDGRAYEELAERFAVALGNAIELYDPAAVVLYGPAFADGPLFDEIARRVVSNDRPCDVRRSRLDPALPALGGTALALERFFADGGAACAGGKLGL